METLHHIAVWSEHWLGGPVDYKQIILLGLLPLFVSCVLIEWAYLAWRGKARSYQNLHSVFSNLNLGLSYQVFELVFHALLLMAAMHWVYDQRFFDVPMSAWTLLPLFVLQEFCYYCFHRASHRVRWFWCAHVVHHSGEFMNLTTAMRQSMLYSITGYWIFFTPMLLIGVSPEWAMTLYAANLAIQFFTHTEAVDRLPAWMEYVFNTPSNHRVHHGRNPEYIDKNYGGVLILFDRWFGTYEKEVAKVDYGIVRQVHSNNIWTLNVHEFSDMIRDIRAPGPLIQRLKHLWAPPEWQRSRPQTPT